MNHASEILLSKPPRISWLTDLQRPHHHGGGQLLTRFGSSHPPEEGLVAFFFYALAYPLSGAQPAVLRYELMITVNK